MASRSQLDQLVAYFASGNKAEFARILGISKQGLNSWYTHEYIDVGKVLYACRDVSIDWLFTGEGEMLIEKRPPVLLQDDKLIPVILDEQLLSGKWDESESFILVRKCPFLDYDFMTSIPNGDLSYYIYMNSLLGCKNVGVDDLIKEYLYIVRTKLQGTFFVQYLGKGSGSEMSVHKFTTRRGNDSQEIQLTIPSEDILRCAEIVDYSVNHFVENVI